MEKGAEISTYTPFPPDSTLLQSYVTTHVLDTSKGIPAEGVSVDVYRIAECDRFFIKQVKTNADGRTTEPVLSPAECVEGYFELIFHVQQYFSKVSSDTVADSIPFYDTIPIRFGVNLQSGRSHYHIPLLLSPYGYSTYRGS